jgi:hypothetical protein
MSVVRTTETVKVKLVDGSDKEVMIYKYITFREEQKIIQTLIEGQKIKDAKDIEIDGAKGMRVIEMLADMIWADKNISLEEVEASSLMEVMSGKFDTFLGKFGFTAKTGDNKSG